MAISANGLSGEITIGGRKAASLGRWSLDGQMGNVLLVDAAVLQTDEYLIGLPTPPVLRLHVGERTWVWRGVSVGGAGDRLTISCSGAPTIVDRT